MDEEKKLPENEDNDYIKAIQELKETTVPKDDYDKLREEHKKLLNAYVEGKDYEGAPKPEEEIDIDELNKQMFVDDNSFSNIGYAKWSLAHRNYVLAHGGRDEYLSYGDKIVPTAESIEAANRIAEGLAYCIDYADGDDETFSNELQRITIDAAPMIGRRK